MSQAQKVLKEAGKLNVLNTSGNNEKVRVHTAAVTLGADDSGKIHIFNSATAFTITLPAVSTAGSGWNAKFIIGTTPGSGTHTITENTASDTNIIHFGFTESAVNAGQAAASSSGTGVTTINFGTNAKKGDYAELVTDGTSWYGSGLCQVDATGTLA